MRTSTLRIVEAGIWSAAVGALTITVLGVVAAVFGDGLLTLKYLLFVVGFLYFGIGTFGIRSRLKRRPDEIETDRTPYLDTDEEWDLESTLQSVPPLRDDHVPFGDRISRNTKLFLTGLGLLAVSFVLEVVFGVRAAAV